MKKKLMGVLMGATLAVGLAACGGNNNADNKDNTGGDTTAVNTDAEAIVKQSCISCHGDNLEGRNGPTLDKTGATLSKDEILDAIENGRTGMPGGLIKGDDAEKVADWLAERK